ncbi:hypothetical protein [Tunturiibacter gelidiferens]|uniref:hypothetical protein n=1 Tax=Tunturiibacter gelidiferens TaxID=3069689 RepID=UPI003D9BAFC0
MSIIVKDETAGLLVFTIDNAGNMTFGDGTPITAGTLGGIGIIDSNGHILHGVGSAAINFASGSGSLSYQGNQVGAATTVTIPTQAGRQPTVQVDSFFPTNIVIMQTGTPENPGGPETIQSFVPSMSVTALRNGSFDITSGTQVSSNTNSTAQEEDAQVSSLWLNYSYRWL